MKKISMIFMLLLLFLCFSMQAQSSFLAPERKIQVEESQTETLVRTNIKGCSVFLNGIYKGTTPLKIKNLIPGNYDLKIEKDDFETKSYYIKVWNGISCDYLIQMKAIEKIPDEVASENTFSEDDHNLPNQ